MWSHDSQMVQRLLLYWHFHSYAVRSLDILRVKCARTYLFVSINRFSIETNMNRIVKSNKCRHIQLHRHFVSILRSAISKFICFVFFPLRACINVRRRNWNNWSSLKRWKLSFCRWNNGQSIDFTTHQKLKSILRFLCRSLSFGSTSFELSSNSLSALIVRHDEESVNFNRNVQLCSTQNKATAALVKAKSSRFETMNARVNVSDCK